MKQQLPETSIERYSRLKCWFNTPSQTMNRLPETYQTYIISEVEKDGRNQLAKERIAEFNAVRDRRLPRDKESLATLTAIFVGALTLSIAPQLIASQSGRGPFAISAGFVGGAAASFYAHANASKALTGMKLKKSTKQARQAIVQKPN